MASGAIVVGNPKAASRTLTVVREVMRQLGGCLRPEPGGPTAPPQEGGLLEVDLAEHAGSVFDWGGTRHSESYR